MKQASIFKDLTFNDKKPSISVLFDTNFTKEIRIAFQAGQMMKEHKSSFPIVVELVYGKLYFGVEGSIHNLVKGDILALDGNIPHDLHAIEESVVRLTLTKADQVDRVQKVVD